MASLAYGYLTLRAGTCDNLSHTIVKIPYSYCHYTIKQTQNPIPVDSRVPVSPFSDHYSAGGYILERWHDNGAFRFALTYLLTPWCRVLREKLTGLQLVKKFPAFHGNRRFITALTSVRHLSLSWASPIQSIYPHPTSWRSILILSTHLSLGLPSGSFPPVSPGRPYPPPNLLLQRATCPVHLILLDFITRTILGEEHKSFSSSLCTLLHSPVTSSLLGPNILNTMFSNTLSFLSSRSVNNQVSTRTKQQAKL